MAQASDQSYYDILEVPASATRDEITRAYHRSKSAYSTSSPALYSVFSKEEALEILKLIDEAYSVLINQDQRQNYDRVLTAKANLKQDAGPSSHHSPRLTELPDFAAPAPTPAIAPAPHTVTTVLSNRPVSAPRPTASPSSTRAKTPTFTRDETFESEIENCLYFDGVFLAKVREYKNITLEQISDLTRIGKHYLRALEKNDVKALPATVFVRGFVVQYAKALAIDEKRAADSYMKILKEQSGK